MLSTLLAAHYPDLIATCLTHYQTIGDSKLYCL